MVARSAAALLLAIASVHSAGAARAETDPLQDPAAARIRAAFKVDGIALFEAHALHAKRVGACAPSVFAGLKWCVSGPVDERRGEIAYTKTTGYNIDAGDRIVYAISTRRGYPLKREAFDGIVQAVGERYGAGATLLAFKKAVGDAGAAQNGGVDSLIAVWGGIRLVQLGEAEYAQVESGQSLKRGHLVDHRFNLVLSAKQREPVYKVEGEAGFILHLMTASPDRADVIARAVYPPVFVPPPGNPGPEAADPLVNETVRRAPRAASAEPGRDRAPAAAADRGRVAERLLREEAERKAAEEKALRTEVERMAAAERRAFERERKRLEEARAAAEARAGRAEAALKADAERANPAEARRSPPHEPAPRAEAKPADDERKAGEQSRAAEPMPAPSSERDVARLDSGRAAEAGPPADGARTPVTIWSFSEDRVAEERMLRSRAIFAATGGSLAVGITFECRVVGRDRRLRAYARGFDRTSLNGVAFRTAGEDSFGVRTRFALDGEAPRNGLLFREHQDDTASFLELPISAQERERDAPRAAIWLRHAVVTIEFPLAAGTVSAAIAPKADSLRRVLEACAQ